MWLTKAHTSQEAPTSTSGSSSLMNVGNNFSATSISKFFKSENRKISVETILNYIKAAEEAFLIYKVSRDDLIGKKY